MYRPALIAAVLALTACAHNPSADSKSRESSVPAKAQTDETDRAERAREAQCGPRTGLGPTADQSSCAANSSLNGLGNSTSQTLNTLPTMPSTRGMLGGR